LVGVKPDDLTGQARDAADTALSDSEKLDWLRLIRTENVGPITFRELIAHFGSAAAALEAIPNLRQRGGMQRPGRVCLASAAERELKAAKKAGARILALPDADYPPLLRHVSAPPPLLYSKGDLDLAVRNIIAVVGSRNASAAGRQFAGVLARDLGRSGIVIASGLARGIDTAAHQAALPTGTIAVLAGGIDSIYPPENAKLYEAIGATGLLLTESPPGFAPRGQDFPRRNRIISGLSSGVVIVEAAHKSGSLITARMALEQDREVFAVPGHPLDPRAGGTNALIRSGAHLTTCADDIINELFTGFRRSPALREPPAPTLDDPSSSSAAEEPRAGDREKLLDALSFTPVHPDVLLRNTDLSPRSLAIALLELDLAGRIDRHDSERISLRVDLASAT
jgi:DNA processing protein